MTAWSVRPLHPAPGSPATAVLIHADDATAREGVYEVARAMSASRFNELRYAVQMYDNVLADEGVEAAETYRLQADEVLDDVSRELGHDLAGVWRVRVGVEELEGFMDALDAAVPPVPMVREGGAA